MVDDDSDMRALVRGALERDGHAVTALACGAQVTPEHCAWAHCILLEMCIRDRRIAGKQSVEIAAPHVMQEDFRHKNAPGLAAVNQCLAFGAPEAPEHAGFFVTPAAGVYAECKAVALSLIHISR